MDRSIEQLNKLDDTEYLNMVKDSRAMMQELHNPKSNSISTGGDTPLEDVFYITEGMFNNQYGDLQANFTGLERVESNYTVDIHIDGNGDYYIYNVDLTSFYDDLAAQIGVEIGNDPNRMLVLCDFNLISIDVANGSSSGTAGINCGAAFAAIQPFFTLANAAWAAEQKGDCPSSTNSYDAADFIRAYANNTVAYPSCPSGQSLYPIVHTGWLSYDANFAPNFNHWLTHAWDYAWHAENNTCLGNTNAEWYILYGRMNSLRNEGLAWAQSLLPGVNNMQFLFTDYHSHGGSDANGIPVTPLPYDTTNGFYHGGVFGYGIIICQ